MLRDAAALFINASSKEKFFVLRAAGNSLPGRERLGYTLSE